MSRKFTDKSQKEKRTRKISQSGSVKSRLSSNSSETSVARLQKKYGNINLQRMYESGAFQAKLKIGKPGDKYEREADRVADNVMNMPEPDISRQENDEEEIQTKSLADQLTPLVQGQHEEEEEIAQATSLQRPEEEEEEPAQTKMLQPQVEEEEELQKQTEDEEEEEPVQAEILQRQDEEDEEPAQAKNIDNKSGTISSNVENSINTIRAGGQPLPDSTRVFFESRFGTDFSGVKVHAGSNANYLAKSINARAFTIGKDVVFGSGQYSPESSSGKQLLAHELTHVVQQNKISDKKISGFTNMVTKGASSVAHILKRPFVGASLRQIIQRDCRDFDAGWIHPQTGRPGPAGTWCETEDEARSRATACPSDCFIYSDGPQTHPHREIPGFPCAHYVAHELGIRNGPRHARCEEGFSVTIRQITQGRRAYPLAQAQVNDIWSNGGHSGIVVRVDAANNRVRIRACSVDGSVYNTWHSDGNAYR